MALEADAVRMHGGMSPLRLHGRRVIYTGEENITRENVVSVLEKALAVHSLNREEELYLERYMRGMQPILHREKKVNGEINNKVVVNLANEIVTFKAAEFAGKPIQYKSRGSKDESVPEKVAKVNALMFSEGKQSKDFELAYRMFTCGVGYRLVFHDRDRKKTDYLDEAPFEICIPDPMNTFVVRLNDVSKRVVMGVTYVFTDPPDSGAKYTVYTENATYTVEGVPGGLEITNEVRHNFGMVTLVEYPCNPLRMGAFEVVLPLLDSLNTLASNRLDGVEQFIQAIMVFEGVDITREQLTELKDLGALKLPPATDGRSSRVYYLNEQLDQTQTQTLVDDMYETILEIVGMPSQGNANVSDSSNNGAVIMKNGWWHAEARAMETQGMWISAETDFLRIALKICSDTNVLTGLKISDLEPTFGRQSYEALLTKTQSFSTLIASGMPAIQAFTYSQLSKDPESDAIVFDAYQEKKAAELDALAQGNSAIRSSGGGAASTITSDGYLRKGSISGSGHPAASTGVCPVCGRSFQKHANNQKYDRAECREKAHRSESNEEEDDVR